MGVEFGVLGDVAVRVDGHLVDVGHARQRCVLVVLLVEANRAVSADQLVERVWGDRAPHRARETLYSYLSRLRHALDPIPGVDLTRQAGGYVLTVDPQVVDVHRFHRLVAEARAAEDEDQALASLEKARGLWRGEPFAGLDTPWVTALRDTLDRDRFAVELDCTDLQLRRGRHGWLLGEIVARAAAYPLDERVASQVMLALYLCGRQAEAMDHFQHLRARLAEELGIDPGPGLRHLYEQILTTDPALTAPAQAGSVPVPAPPPVPRQLPAHTPHFVGRAAELRQLTTLLDSTTGAGGGTVVITAIGGTAGIGKTALALHWAHQAAERFPDGQLYVNLRGFDPTNTPMHPADALRGFFDAHAIPPQQIPTSLDAQAALYRSLLTDRRVLVVLDNARDAEQVRPLLPASPTCLVLIASRNQLTGLIAQEGARPLTLDLLTPQEAHALLARHLGPDRINAEANAVTDLIDHCARLPLALAIVAARASTHPGFELRVLAKELANEHTRLDALDTGDPTSSVRAVFSWSYQHLTESAARMFRLLGLQPGPDIALPAATQLANIPPNQARETLSELTRAHLLTQHTPGRYTFHDLLRDYATHLTTTHEPPDDHHAALTRLFDHYLHTTATAMDTLHPAHQHRRPRLKNVALATRPMPNPTTARAWLDTERANLTAVIAHTAAHGWYAHTTLLANTLFRYLDVGGHYPDALTIHTHARHAAHRTNDRATEALALTNLGIIHEQQGRYQQATDQHQQAITLSREIGDRDIEARALCHLGLVHWYQCHYQQAANYLQQTLVLFGKIGDRVGEATALTFLGDIYWRQGNNGQAGDFYQQALTICRDIGDRVGEVRVLTGLGVVHCQQGHFQQGVDHHQQALAICRDIGYRNVEARPLCHLGLVHCQQGHFQQAIDHHQQALAICRDIGDRNIEALALTYLGLVHCQQGHFQQAIDHHQQALAICRDIGDRNIEALALTYLGLVHCQQGHFQQAIDHHQQALAICRDIGDRANEAQILNGLAEAHHGSGQLDQARARHAAALTLATELGDRYEQACAHRGLAHTHHTTGNLDQARHHWQQALTLYIDLGVPDADDVRAHLTALNHT